MDRRTVSPDPRNVAKVHEWLKSWSGPHARGRNRPIVLTPEQSAFLEKYLKKSSKGKNRRKRDDYKRFLQARSFDGDVRARVPDNVFRRLRPGGYYIPAVAMRLGAVETELPLGDIARKIVAVVERTASRSTSVARG